MLSSQRVERRLQISGIFLLLGLLIEALCLVGKGPIAFMLFTGLSSVLFLAGIGLYLHMLVSAGHSPRRDDSGTR